MKYLWTEDTGAGSEKMRMLMQSEEVHKIYIDYYRIKERGSMRAEDDLTYQEYKEALKMLCVISKIHGWTPRQVTDRMTDEDNELLIGTSEALWIISIGAYEVEHDILEERVLEQLSYHIPRYEMGKYKRHHAGRAELLEKDIAFIRSKVELWKLKSYED